MSGKRCSRCREVKDVDLFFRDKRSMDGVKSHCKECDKADKVAYRNANRDKIRSYQRDWEERNRDSSNARKRAWNHRNPVTRPRHPGSKAHHIVQNEIRAGRLVRPDACESCGRSTRVQAHHDDYAKPLEVRWLCGSCHCFLHRSEVAA